MRDEQTVQSEHSQKVPEDVVKLLIGVGQMVWFGYKGNQLLQQFSEPFLGQLFAANQSSRCWLLLP